MRMVLKKCLDVDERKRPMDELCDPARDTLLFSGGGLKILAFCGALNRLYTLRPDHGANFRVFSGVSAGGALSLCLALGYSPQDALLLMQEGSILGALNKQTLSLASVVSGGGLLERVPIARVLATWLHKAKLSVDITFRDFRRVTGKVLRTAVCTVGSSSRLIVIDDTTHPNLPVLRGILASMAVPFMFDPVEIQGRLCVDPAVINNLCLFCCTPRKTIAFLSGGDTSSTIAIGLTCRMNLLMRAEVAFGMKEGLVLIRMPPVPDPTYHLFRVGDGSETSILKILQQGRDAVDAFAASRAALGFLLWIVCSSTTRHEPTLGSVSGVGRELSQGLLPSEEQE